ncbi:MAG TPA: AAA family ATPase [Acidimicrobiales bacterium]
MAGVNEQAPVIVSFQSLADEILKTESPRLVAVDGRGGSGKTTFATRLARLLPAVVVIEVDDFLNWSDLDDWWPRVEDEAITPLLAGERARFRIRDWDTDPLGESLDGWRDVGPADTIILEGVTSSRASMAQRLSMSFWLEAPPNVRLARGLARDGQTMRSTWQNWMRLEDEFFERDDAPGRATYVVVGDAAVPYDEETEALLLGLTGGTWRAG